jgi:hypothetical protein
MSTLYGKFSAADLRLLLTFLPQFERETNQICQILSGNGAVAFSMDSLPFSWCAWYEMPHTQHFSEMIAVLGLAGELREVAASGNAIQKMEELSKRVDGLLDEEFERQPEELAKGFSSLVLAMCMSMIFSLRCLLVYGRYLHELIADAKSGADLSLRDKALLSAVRIDPTVVGCPTAISRISRAVVLNDQKFLNKLRRAMSVKLGASESATYQKLRLILQVLHEAGAGHLNDDELLSLFVNELNIYSESAGASKNLSEFTRNFKKKKSTI